VGVSPELKFVSSFTKMKIFRRVDIRIQYYKPAYTCSCSMYSALALHRQPVRFAWRHPLGQACSELSELSSGTAQKGECNGTEAFSFLASLGS
jgi:hypothetical protein